MVVNLIPGVAPVQPVTSIIPLVFVVGVAMVKEAVEDWVLRWADSMRAHLSYRNGTRRTGRRTGGRLICSPRGAWCR